MMLDKPMRSLEMRIMEDIVRHIKINGEITRSADWQIERLSQLGMAREDIQNALKDTLNLDDKEVAEMYRNVIKSGYVRDRTLYEAVGASFIPFEENAVLQQLISAVAGQTNETLHNITQSLGFAVRGADGKLSFSPIADYYQKTLDNAMLDIASGAFDYNTVLKRTVKEMTNSGLRTVDYASGWSNRVDVAARRAVVTGMSQLTAKVNEDNAQQLNTDWFEVTWHSGARPEHLVWSGRWYTRKQLETVCGLGTVTGLCGANCYHDYYPVIPGISEPTYTDEELAELNAKENTPIEYNGKQYTKYEALQRQRRLETTVRAQRQEIKLLKEGGASEDDLINARARYRGTSHEYAKFSQAMGLPQQRERVTVDGLGNIGQGKYTGGSGKESPVQVPPVGAKVTDKVTDQERVELLRKNSIDISSKSGIIKESSNSKPITEITDKAIESVPKVNISGYTDEQCTTLQKQHKELLSYSRKHNDNNEVAFVFDSSLGNRKEFTGSDDIIDFGGYLSGKDLILLHNHPRNSSYSFNDIVEFFGNDRIKTLTIVKNNGKVEALTKISSYNNLDMLKALNRINNDIKKKAPEIGEFRNSLYRKETEKFLKKYQLGGLIEWIK